MSYEVHYGDSTVTVPGNKFDVHLTINDKGDLQVDLEGVAVGAYRDISMHQLAEFLMSVMANYQPQRNINFGNPNPTGFPHLPSYNQLIPPVYPTFYGYTNQTSPSDKFGYFAAFVTEHSDKLTFVRLISSPNYRTVTVHGHRNCTYAATAHVTSNNKLYIGTFDATKYWIDANYNGKNMSADCYRDAIEYNLTHNDSMLTLNVQTVGVLVIHETTDDTAVD